MAGAHPAPFYLFLSLLMLGGVQGQKDCIECFQMNIGVMIGIIVADIVVTILIALAVFLLATKIQNKRKKWKNGNTQKMSTSYAEGIEPTYQELQEPKPDVYSELSR